MVVMVVELMVVLMVLMIMVVSVVVVMMIVMMMVVLLVLVIAVVLVYPAKPSYSHCVKLGRTDDHFSTAARVKKTVTPRLPIRR